MSKNLSRQSTKNLSLPLADAYITFMVDREARQFTAKTLAYYRERLGDFFAHCDHNHIGALQEVTAPVVRAYLVSLQRRGLAPHTVHGAARAIRTFVRFCAEDGLIDTAPVFAMPKVPKKILPAFEAPEVARMLDACTFDRDKLIILTLLDTGLRLSEFVALDGGDIDTITGAVFVREGKGQKQRTVYIGARTRRELGRYWRSTGRPAAKAPVWTSRNTGERLTPNGLRQIVTRIGERAGVAHCHPHTFRRTFALWSLRGGMDVHTLAALMGHADIHVLKQYLALTGQDLQRAHREAGPVDKMFRR